MSVNLLLTHTSMPMHPLYTARFGTPLGTTRHSLFLSPLNHCLSDYIHTGSKTHGDFGVLGELSPHLVHLHCKFPCRHQDQDPCHWALGWSVEQALQNGQHERHRLSCTTNKTPGTGGYQHKWTSEDCIHKHRQESLHVQQNAQQHSLNWQDTSCKATLLNHCRNDMVCHKDVLYNKTLH